MRIISGRYKGRRFDPPSNITARPTTDFAKESLFNLISNRIDIEGSTVLDLFSGTGSISYEFASREAMHITSVEMSEKHIAFIKKVIADLRIKEIKVVRQDVFRFLENTKYSYDIIFADPPYQMENIKDIPDAVFANNHLNSGGILIVEHGKSTDFEQHPNFVEHRKYGNVHFSFFENKNE